MRRGPMYLGMIASATSSLSVALSVSAQNVPPSAGYEPVAEVLRYEIQQEMADKQLPALSIALVDGGSVVWAEGFGYEDAAKQRPATAHTIYRVGSVSKLFTDVAVMQMVERGRLDLDAPVSRYIPDFHPHNTLGGEITLRELMSHRAGLLREPPVGHYFDASNPSLQATVTSLNDTALVFTPGTHTKYSNAGIAAVGYALQTIAGEPFAAYLKKTILQPLGMNESAFTLEPQFASHLAEGRMWSYDGLNFPAPTFPLGESPAGAMYTSVSDLGRFLCMIFGSGSSGATRILQPASLHAMQSPQFGGPFGLGFALGTLDGHRMLGHGGAIYGFATQLSALPDDKLGVVVVTSVDGANAVTTHLGDDALRAMLAQRNGAPLPHFVEALPVDPHRALAAAGRYSGPDGRVTLQEQEGRLRLSSGNGGGLYELKDRANVLIRDNRIAYSTTPVSLHGDAVTIDEKTFTRIPSLLPSEVQPQWRELIGEYGWDYDKLYVFEDAGKMQILVEWFDFEPMEKIAEDRFQLPDRGLYQSEPVSFIRSAQHAITGVRIGSVIFPRLPLPQDGQVFQITPLKPVPQLRREALASSPPAELGDFRQPDLVELTSLDPTIKLDIRYASTRNFLGAPLYLQARAFMQRPAAEAVARVSAHLRPIGYGLLIHDSYRPWYVTKMFWEGTPDDKKIFVADPSLGSRHNRGCAVDLTLYDLKTGKPIVMTGGYDEMSERSYPFYPGGTERQRWQRDLLRHSMEAEGFNVYEFEWWHFDYKDWRHYPILNFTFEELDQGKHMAR